MSGGVIGRLLQRLVEAPGSERNKLLKQFADDLLKSGPALAKAFWSWVENDDPLSGLYMRALERVHERSDMSEGERSESLMEAAEFFTRMDIIRDAPNGLVSRDVAFDLAIYGILTGLRAGLAPDELRRMRQGWLSNNQSAAGKKSGDARRAGRAWVPHATKLAQQIQSESTSLSRERIAEEVANRWKLEDVASPSHRTLTMHISALMKEGGLRQRTGSRRK